MNKIIKKRLANGLKIIGVRKPNAKSVTLGVYVKAGSRYEGDYPEGIAHFLEHMVFEGSKNYPNEQRLVNLIESHGGSYNARTDFDNTYYYCQLPKKYYQVGLEYLNELINRPLLKEASLKREKLVIIEEMKYKNDIPEIRAARNLFELMGEGSSLSRHVSGSRESVRSTTIEDIKGFHKDFYRPNNMVLVAVGDIDIKEVFKDVANMFDRPAKRGPKFREEFKPSQVDPRIKLDIRDIDQAHLFVGVYGYGYNDSRRFGLAALTNILGQGMSSRLYKALRVKKGYSYAPEALYYPMIGIGELMMGGGFKQDKAVESVKIILEELSKLKKSGVSGAELEQTKKYLIGSIDLDQDDLSDINEYYGSQELLYKNQLDFKDLKAKIESVSKEQLKQIANEIFLNSRINLSVVGPYQGKRKEFERVFKFK